MNVICNSFDRPEPIPVFAEMGSVNPVVVLPEALQQHFDAVVSGASLWLLKLKHKRLFNVLLVEMQDLPVH